jgi:hypothetical protein
MTHVKQCPGPLLDRKTDSNKPTAPSEQWQEHNVAWHHVGCSCMLTMALLQLHLHCLSQNVYQKLILYVLLAKLRWITFWSHPKVTKQSPVVPANSSSSEWRHEQETGTKAQLITCTSMMMIRRRGYFLLIVIISPCLDGGLWGKKNQLFKGVW